MLLGIEMLIAVVIFTAAILAPIHNINLDRYQKYLPIGVILVALLATGGFRTIYRLLRYWFRHESNESEPPA
jgi:hypothetical protein